MNKLAATLLLLAFCSVAQAEKPLAPATIPGATTVTSAQVVEKIQTSPDLVVIDARRSGVYAKGHIRGAINLLDTEMTEQELAKHAPSKETPLLFYCNGASCLRSSNAVHKALKWGYQHVYWFRGGWQEWISEELPITR